MGQGPELSLRAAVATIGLDDGERLAQLVRLRHQAFSELQHRSGHVPGHATRVDVPSTRPNAVAVGDRLELAIDGSSVDELRTQIGRYGCALIPGAIDASTIEQLRGGIDRTFDEFDGYDPSTATATPSPWFHPFDPDAATEEPGRALDLARKRDRNREAGSVWAADAPGMLARILETYDRVGLIRLLTDYFGEAPAISMNKCTLRRLEPDASTGDWHQDGAFMAGEATRSLNAWLALSDCGRDAPGMDIVPTRLRLAETGTPGAWFDWSVSPDEVDRVRGAVPVLRPDFEAGDVLLFDHLFLHRTSECSSKQRRRYAVETWFFPPSDYPPGQVPLLV